MTTLKKLVIILPILLGMGLFAFMKFTKQAPVRHGNKERVQIVRVIPLEKTHVVPRSIGYGYVEADSTWEAIPEVSGKIVYMNKNLKKGYFIKKGDLLLKIDTTTYGLAEKRGAADLMSVDAHLRELEQSKKNTQGLLSIEKLSLTSAAQELKRKRELFAKGYLSASDMEKEERTFLSHQTTVNNLENILDLIPSQKKALQAQKTSGESTMTERRLNVAKTDIFAPFNCRLSAVNIELHQFASAGTVLVEAQSVDRAEIPIQLAPSNFLRLMPRKQSLIFPDKTDIETLRRAIDIKAKVRLPMDGDKKTEWEARFSRTSESMDLKTGALTIYVTVDNPYGNVLPGIRPPLVTNMYVEVELRGRSLPDRFVIPRGAVHGGNIYICTPENKLDIRPAAIEFQMEDMTVLSTGIDPGETLVLSDLIPAVEGMKLKPVLDNDTAERLKRMAIGEAL
ncbi:MAG: hypothetical protein HOG03_22945 [Desulfobacula sp.]|jgi:multidrug efflux pump subunit AcrA (membrane-fusion protein)|uniref:efflux RND transporter periplasmic adaptor subunit n=1 Tax=Desulfobacula sp. TaxID=2593537 RepID=UPI001DBFFE7E|nr:hypothetical protein [Desulfobacula sp.]MBT3487801.1 hypothetical protein [Desulfobacula sp.]MBT3807421.1 hypothetical protein [Desulfobacula sp.]MBT4027556.1 hypothetical protein [Desulfobacula sp.]MBT4199537.1 hypothetical protein [Desulfobacula sp.]